MTGNNNPNYSAYWGNVLSAAGVPQSVIQAAASDMASGATVSNATTANNALTSALTANQISTDEVNIIDNFYSNIVDPALTSTLSDNGINFSLLATGVGIPGTLYLIDSPSNK